MDPRSSFSLAQRRVERLSPRTEALTAEGQGCPFLQEIVAQLEQDPLAPLEGGELLGRRSTWPPPGVPSAAVTRVERTR